MKHAGIALLVIGTIVGSLGGAKLPKVDWVIAGVGFGMLAIAIVLLRMSAAKDRKERATADGADPREDPLGAIRTLPKRLDVIVEEAASQPLKTLIEKLSELDTELMSPIADGAPRLLGTLGAQRFASIFGDYASGERWLTRAWSAAADQHRPEALKALERARTKIHDAVEAIDAK